MTIRQWLVRLLAISALAATPALAQDGGELRFCPNRPSLGASACTTNPGHVQFEYSAVDWQRDGRAREREDQVIVADLLARIGIGEQTEIQIGWTAFGTDRTERRGSDAGSGPGSGGGSGAGSSSVSRVSSIGDVRLALRQNIRNPAGDGLSFGIEPFVIIPLGRQPISSGDWGAGAMVPITVDLSPSITLSFTGQVAALADEDGRGRHANYNGILGLGYEIADAVTLASEVSVERDHDPMGHETHLVAAQSLAWQVTKRTQLDVLVAAGLTRTTPDVRLALGGAILF